MSGPHGVAALSGSTDLEDMSVMVLRTQGPAALFDDHRLILHTSSYDAKWARVFHACGEFMPILSPCAHCLGWGGVSVSPPWTRGQALLWLPACPGGQGNMVRWGNSETGGLVSPHSYGPGSFDWIN